MIQIPYMAQPQQQFYGPGRGCSGQLNNFVYSANNSPMVPLDATGCFDATYNSSTGSSASASSSPTSHQKAPKRSKATKVRKTKRIRTTFTPEQLKVLEHEFAIQMYLVGEYREVLAQSLGLSEGQVKVWFQNRRIKHRKLLQQQGVLA